MEYGLVRSALRTLFGDHPELAECLPAGEVAELTWDAERLHSQWLITFGDRAVRHIGVSVHDIHPDRWAEDYRGELARALAPLAEIATAAGARLFVDGEDLTGRPLRDIVEELC
jgi:hypothetical protein